mmetsp:Transcript_31057/g.53446  ORF Transcript_31057/g.53446 Transcript_31057/m.53446 type:complete len:98 (+) Transcript_31057:484-777(+)
MPPFQPSTPPQPKELVDVLFKMQHKVEDGALSMGLGHKAGKGLPLFNESLQQGQTTFRLVLVKRPGGTRSEEAPLVPSLKKQLSDEGRRLLLSSIDG